MRRIIISFLCVFLTAISFSQEQANAGSKEYPVFKSCAGETNDDFCTEMALNKYLEEHTVNPFPKNKSAEVIKVLVMFTIERDGNIRQAQILKSVNEAYDTEALRVIKSIPHFLPVIENGKLVRFKTTYYVKFLPKKKRRKKRK